MDQNAGSAEAELDKPVWNKELDEEVRRLWMHSGLSARDIGERVGKTRNSVLSHIDRCREMGLIPNTPSTRNRSGRKPTEASRLNFTKKSTANPQPPPSPATSKSEIVVPERERRGIDERLPDQCRWPIGDPCSQEFHFCHHKRERGSFCEHHAAIAYQPSYWGSQVVEAVAGVEI